MSIQLPYGNGVISVKGLEQASTVDWIQYAPGRLAGAGANDPVSLIRQTLASTIASPQLSELARGQSSAVILISDRSRLCPSYLFLPLLLDSLNEGGIPDTDIEIIVALGAHRKHTEAELAELVGDAVVVRGVRVSNHSCLLEDCLRVGTSSRGTPLEINRRVVETGLIVATGNIEPHRLVGMSGGVKAIIPGAASRECITANHALSQHIQATPGHPDNPIHQDLEEVLPLLPPVFLLNLIVTQERTVLGAVAGDVVLAHRAGVERYRSIFLVPPGAAPYDLVLASAGGHPKDMHLYQAMKTIQNAAPLVRPGGTIVLAARCEEGFGNGVLHDWIETIQDRARMTAMLKQAFVLGAHKVEQLDKVLQEKTVFLYSDMPSSLVELTGIRPVPDLEAALRSCVDSGLRRVAVMPYGALTFADG
ncbi:nickel-dependent lactate racemase [Paenibacillus koleovorans]|uniref:nickel-dependent lactate racemase n=1 Tax=Paenibacillus koleovorans TaxID=121608 RepID=UPI000FDC32A7|nr:nickel-dependent lactate racemase [Paenibacillus koleovorans]